MLQINTNLSALTGLRSLNQTARSQAQTIERLSTGQRINKASDDPSGLVISEKLRAQISGLNQALENTQNDINLINTAEAALGEISDMLVDMRSSVIFAMNSGFSIPEQIDAEQDKIDQTLVAIDRIAQSTRFAQRNLLDGSSDFIIEQNASARSATDFLQIRQARLGPSTEAQTFSVNVTQLAERATLITNINFNAVDQFASLSAGGNAADFATLRVSGSRGSTDVNFGSSATMQDLIGAVNQNSTSTGVYASTFLALPIESTRREAVVDNTTTGISVGEQGNAVVLGVSVNGGAVQNLIVRDTDGDGLIFDPGAGANDLQTALQTIDANFTVDTDINGNARINNAGSEFTIGPAENVKTIQISAADLNLIEDADGSGNIDIDFDLDGDGAADVGGAGFTVAITAGAGPGTFFNSNLAADRQALLTALTANLPTGTQAYFDSSNNLTLFDSTGTNFQSAGSNAIGLTVAAGDAAAGATLTSNPTDNGSFSGGLVQAGMPSAGLNTVRRPVQYANFDVNSQHIDAAGDLAIATTAVAGGTFSFTISDPDSAAADTVTLNVADTDTDGFIRLAEINAAIAAAAGVGAGTLDAGASFEAYFSREKGLTFVYDNVQLNDNTPQFTVGEAAGSSDLFSVTGSAGKTSVENTERLALYSLDFGSDSIIQLEDVTSSTSTVSLKAGSATGGIRATTDGRSGLGVFENDVNTMIDLNGGSLISNGVDVQGTVNGMVFDGTGFDVQLVNSALDIKMSLAESFGSFGSVGNNADAVEFGLNNQVGGTAVNPTVAGTTLPEGIMDSFQFTVRQNFSNGNRGQSGLRFQIRETNSAQDSLNIGIRGVTTGDLGLDVTPESADSTSAQRINSLSGGSLASLRTGAGNDLFQNPENALEVIDAAIDQVADLRSFLGSISTDTLQRNLNSVGVALENLVSSESSIRDLDFAAETTEFARQQVLYSAGASVLASANQIPQVLLQLLQ